VTLAALQWQNVWPALIEIALLFSVIYAVLRFLQGTRGTGLLRGLVFFLLMALLVVVFLVEKLQLLRIEFLMGGDTLIFFLFIVVLFQPEIRRLLLRMGEAPVLRMLLHTQPSVVPEIVDAMYTLAEKKMGALVVIEREVGLGTVIEGGTQLDATISSEFIVTIFWPGTPLHDGALIIRGNRAVAAGCLLPLTEQSGLAKTLGTRHRAAIGITEESDALSVVVSEETQRVSVAYRGQLRVSVERDQLRRMLEEILTESVTSAPANTHS